MVEILLQLLVGEVDAQLLKIIELVGDRRPKREGHRQLDGQLDGQTNDKKKVFCLFALAKTIQTISERAVHYLNIYLKDLKAGNVQHSDEVLARQSCVQTLVDPPNHPLKHAVIGSLRQGSHRVVHLHTETPKLSHVLHLHGSQITKDNPNSPPAQQSGP